MQRYPYMRPALQKSEAVLLPALPRMNWTEPVEIHPSKEATFVPATEEWHGQTTALSTQLRYSGSMAGRGVLRAAGVSDDPFCQRARPRYYRSQSRQNRAGIRRFW